MDMNNQEMYKQSMGYFRAIQSIQDVLGKEGAESVIKALDAIFQALEEKAREKEIQIKIEVAEQVKKELKEELATRYDLLQAKSELKEEIVCLRLEIEKRFNRLYLVLLGLAALILGTNPTLLELLGKLLGILPK